MACNYNLYFNILNFESGPMGISVHKKNRIWVSAVKHREGMFMVIHRRNVHTFRRKITAFCFTVYY